MMIRDLTELITAADIAAYRDRGFWVGPVVFTEEQVAVLRDAHERVWRNEFDHYRVSRTNIKVVPGEPGGLRHAIDASWNNDTIRRAVTSPVIGYLASKLIPAAVVRLWHDQLLYKPPSSAPRSALTANVGWHQDFAYARMLSSPELCTAWIALQDTTLENGAMRMVVGSHRWGFVEGSDQFPEGDLDKVRLRYASCGEWDEAVCEVKAGAVSFHHGLIVHGSGPNHSSQPRLAVVAHLMADGTCYNAAGGWDPNVTLLGPDSYDGQPFAGSCWPVVWDEAAGV